MCSCVQIQRDVLSTKGVKINVLFTFILTVTQQASEEFPVTFFRLFGADRVQSVQIMEPPEMALQFYCYIRPKHLFFFPK